jgi:uncharacterized protein (DUF433 family)
MPTWIVADTEHCGGKPRITGTSIPLHELLEALAAGLSIGDIRKKYPVLSEEAIRGAIRELARWQGIGTPPI